MQSKTRLEEKLYSKPEYGDTNIYIGKNNNYHGDDERSNVHYPHACKC